jgi:glutamate--cysteine ligase
MPATLPQLTEQEAADRISAASLQGASAGVVGLECEWFPTPRPSMDNLRAALTGVVRPGGSTITFEPGGQVELSSPPVPGVAAAADALAADFAAISSALACQGVSLLATGLHPTRDATRVVHSPRYAAMEAYFDRDGQAGRTMMCSTAALQVNVDLGAGDEARRRWTLAHRLGPVLLASFANSPVAGGKPTGWKSTRAATWMAIDRSRTAPPAGGLDGWVDYALDARVMLVRTRADGHDFFEPVLRPLSFRAWVQDGHRLGWPTEDDLDYHLTTLFPPIRPKGWLELRFIDALPDPWWRAAAAVAVTLLDDPVAHDRAAAALDRITMPVAWGWRTAARCGLEDPELGMAAEACFEAAADRADPALAPLVVSYLDRYVSRRLCPADDVVNTRVGA